MLQRRRRRHRWQRLHFWPLSVDTVCRYSIVRLAFGLLAPRHCLLVCSWLFCRAGTFSDLAIDVSKVAFYVSYVFSWTMRMKVWQASQDWDVGLKNGAPRKNVEVDDAIKYSVKRA